MNNLKNIICAALIGSFSTFLPFWQWGGLGRQLFAAAMTTMIIYGVLWDIDTPERKEKGEWECLRKKSMRFINSVKES